MKQVWLLGGGGPERAKLGDMPEPVMPEPVETAAAPARGALLRRLFGNVRLAYLPVLVTYFCYGASGITGIAMLYFQKDTLGITPAEAAAIAFWVALPWSTKMVAGVLRRSPDLRPPPGLLPAARRPADLR